MQGNDSFRLVVRRGPQPNQTYDLNKDIITVGRDITNDITINDPEVSRHHMRFTRGAGGFTLEDLGSTNGTFVNSHRLTGAKPLNNGDTIGLGETVTLGYELVRPMMAQQPPMGGVAPEPQTVANPVPRQQDYGMQPGVSPVAPQSPGVYDYNPSQPYSASAAPGVPASQGYDYDPYAVREEERSNTMRMVLIGCVVASVFCCCGTVVGLFLVDVLNLWCRIPLLYPILNAFGFYSAAC
jgi:hypothetical protein